MSSAEMLCLIRNLPIILGDLIPETDLHCKLLILLFKMVQIVTAKAQQPKVCNLLETLTSEYLILLTEMYPGSLVLKHHFLIHYAGKMKLFGPLSKISCLPYERKHREGKMTARSSLNRINVYKTISLKHYQIRCIKVDHLNLFI